MNFLINIAAFKIGWFSSVFGAANNLPLLGPAVVALVIAIHLRNAREPTRELFLVLLTGVIGASWDSVMVAAGWLSYSSGTLVSGIAPYWILAMWMSFATTLNLAFRWLQSRLLLASVLGAISGPATYYFGASLGAVEFNNTTAALSALSLAWAALLPALLVVAKRLDGVSMQTAEARV